MGWVAILTSPPVLRAIVALAGMAVQFFTGIDAGTPEISFGDRLILERVDDRVEASGVVRCWRIVEVPEGTREAMAEVFGVPEAMIVETAVLCRNSAPREVPVPPGVPASPGVG